MPGYRIDREAAAIGEHLKSWRMVLGLTAAQVGERAGVSVDTLRRVERGSASVGFGAVLQVSRALGQLDRIVEALDPLGTDLGRARAALLDRKRVR